MIKINLIGMSLIVCFLGSIVTACAPSRSATLTAAPVPNQTPTSVPTEPALLTTSGAFFALSVSDIDASAKWYSENLDLEIIMQPPKTNQAAVIVLEGGGLIVELIQQDGALPLNEVAPDIKEKTLVHGIIKAGVIVEDFDATITLLRERNVTIAFGPFPATADQRANVIIQDNEGNLIQFIGK